MPRPLSLWPASPNNAKEKLTQWWENQRYHLVIPSSSNLGDGRSIFPNSAPWPLWPLFLPGIWKPLWLEFGREFSVLGGISWLSPNRENIPFFFGNNFGSSFSPTSSKISSSVSCGRSDWPELRTADRGGRLMPDSRLCRGVVEASGRTGDRAEMSWQYKMISPRSLGLIPRKLSYEWPPVWFKWLPRYRERFIVAQHRTVAWWRRRGRPLPETLLLRWWGLYIAMLSSSRRKASRMYELARQ